MLNDSSMNYRLQKLTWKVLRTLCLNHDIIIGDGDLKIILRIMQNNPCSVLDEDFRPILFIQIENMIGKDACNDFKPMIEKGYMIKEMK